MPPGAEPAAGATGKDGGEIRRLVEFAAAEARSEEKHRVVEERAVPLPDGIHLLHQAHKLLDVEAVELGQIVADASVPLIVRPGVVRSSARRLRKVLLD